MAELDTSRQGEHKGGKKPRKKLSTRIDLTPMVDLGFLLVTFFMLTTTFTKPQTMELNMPVRVDNPGKPPVIPEKKALSLIINGNEIIWYRGMAENPVDPFTKTDFSNSGIRKVLLEKSKIDGVVALIKATDKASYKNLVDILDEMSICNIKRYAIIDIADIELEKIKGI